MSILFSNLPLWARETINRAETNATLQITNEANSLVFVNGVAYFNKQLVADREDEKEDKINFFSLPLWAIWDTLVAIIKDTNLVRTENKSSLIVVGGFGVFNGKRIVFF